MKVEWKWTNNVGERILCRSCKRGLLLEILHWASHLRAEHPQPLPVILTIYKLSDDFLQALLGYFGILQSPLLGNYINNFTLSTIYVAPDK